MSTDLVGARDRSPIVFSPAVSSRSLALLALASLVLGAAIRGPIVLGVDFPLNDGGLFLAFIEKILADGFAFPDFVDWNGYRVPFAYPPLSFYALAGLARATGIEPLKLVQYVPLVVNLVSVPVFVCVAARLLPGASALFFAAVAFPILPRSYEWLVMGGGVSRSPAMLATLIALLLTMEAIDRRRKSLLVAATVVLGIVLALHLEWGISGWVATTLVLFMARPPKEAITQSIAMGFGMGLVSLPWWGTVVSIHGITPYVAALSEGGWEAETLTGRITNFDLFTLPGSWIAIAAAFGVALAWNSRDRRQHLVIAWLLLIFATTPRHAKTVAAIPVAMLVGLAVARLSDLIFARLRLAAESGEPLPSSPPPRPLASIVHAILAASLVAYVVWEVSHLKPNEQSTLVALTPEERAGMAWIAKNVDESARFLVVSNALGWAWDRDAEWFPELAARRSVNTLQGLEWIEGYSFADEMIRADTHRQAAFMSPSIAPQLGLQLFGPTHDHVAVFAPDGSPLRQSYAESTIYEPVHEQAGMSVYRLRPEIQQRMMQQANAVSGR